MSPFMSQVMVAVIHSILRAFGEETGTSYHGSLTPRTNKVTFYSSLKLRKYSARIFSV